MPTRALRSSAGELPVLSNVLCVILGGGRGTRLFPLTKERAKPAVPLAGKYRLIDIAVSNCLNSGLNRVYVLTQFNSESLNKHIHRTYRLDPFSRGFVEIIAAEQRMDRTDWFQGTADAVRACLRHFRELGVEEILILSGDQLYTMDFRALLAAHRQRHADVTLCVQAVPSEESHRFGIVRTGADERVTEFVEKPTAKAGADCLASMGIYVFRRDVLVRLVEAGQEKDFGREVLPKAIHAARVFAHRFTGYWEDIGTIGTFYKANLDLAGPQPPIDLFSEQWRFFTRGRHLPPAAIHDAHVTGSLIVDGARVDGARVDRSIVGVRALVGRGSELSQTVVFGADYYEEAPGPAGVPPMGIGPNCRIVRAIIDKNARVGAGAQLVNRRDVQEAEGPGYAIRDGIIVVEKDAVIPPGTSI